MQRGATRQTILQATSTRDKDGNSAEKEMGRTRNEMKLTIVEEQRNKRRLEVGPPKRRSFSIEPVLAIKQVAKCLERSVKGNALID